MEKITMKGKKPEKVVSANPGENPVRFQTTKTTDDRIRELKKALGLDKNKFQGLKFQMSLLKNTTHDRIYY